MGDTRESREVLRDTLRHHLEALTALRALPRPALAPEAPPGEFPGPPFVIGMIISSDHTVLAFKNGWVLAHSRNGSEYAIWKYTVREDGQVTLSHADFYYTSVHGAADAAIKAAERFTELTEKTQ